MAKKSKSNTPKCKRMSRDQRLQSAKHWLPTYTGKNIVRGYKRHFAVDEVCAQLELRALGKNIEDAQIENARKAAQRRAEAKVARRAACEGSINRYPDSDFFHYYVVGYTAGGFSYGVTWEQAEAEGLLDK